MDQPVHHYIEALDWWTLTSTDERLIATKSRVN